jgi:hypothetical protein
METKPKRKSKTPDLSQIPLEALKEEIERRKHPQPLAKPNLNAFIKDVQNAVKDMTASAITRSRDLDEEDYFEEVYEAALEAIYGSKAIEKWRQEFRQVDQ